MNEHPPIRSRADVDAIYDDVAAVYDGYFSNRRSVDWEEFLDRLESRGYDLGEDMETPATRRIRQIVRELRAQQG